MNTDEIGAVLERVTTGVMAALLLMPAAAGAQALDISRSDSRTTRQAPAENFTGVARIDMLFDRLHTADASGGVVTFEPGARTAWHSHPGGQTLVVTAGTGRVQRWGDAVHEVREGDVVRIPPGQKHWHGAAPTTSMAHLAITEPRDGTVVQWMEQVSDEQYRVVPTNLVAAQPAAARAAPPPAVAGLGEPAPPSQSAPRRPSGELQQRLAPGLASLTDDVLYGDVWQRRELSPRDRSLVTLSVLIATGKTAQLGGHLARGLENGIQPREASGLLAHLAVYCGWPSAVSALAVYEQVFAARKVDTAALRHGQASPQPTGLAPPPAVPDAIATTAPKFAQLTTDMVIGDLWRRGDLSPRDRSLITIAAIAALGDEGQLDVYLSHGLSTGLTRVQIAEALTHLAFYAGWSRASTAVAALARLPQAVIR